MSSCASIKHMAVIRFLKRIPISSLLALNLRIGWYIKQFDFDMSVNKATSINLLINRE